MDMMEKINSLMTRYGLNKHTLAEKSGIPYMTITSFFKAGYKNAKMSTLYRLSQFFNVPMDYLLLDQYQTPEEYYLTLGGYNPSTDEGRLLQTFRLLNQQGRQALLSYADIVSGNPAMTAATPPSTEKKAT
ncbi:MAG: helix-turn-helix transcriptional regulator [Clostridia bacterium]|nr:helix-turn-helix transcriptional regulator [Clostridia bacterium]